MKCICIDNKDINKRIKEITLPEDINKEKDENNFVAIGYKPNARSDSQYFVTINQTYDVCGILIYDEEMYFLLHGLCNTELYSSKLFKVIDNCFYFDWWTIKEYTVENKQLILIGFEEFTDYNNFMGLLSGNKKLMKDYLELIKKII